MGKKIKLWVACALPLLVLGMPTIWIPLQGVTVVEHRLLAIFVMATVFWILEPIPIFATSLLIVLAELVMVSDKGFVLFVETNDQGFGHLLHYKDIMGAFASPIIMLFLGGFFLAMAATKYRLDQNLARILLKPFGSKPRFILLGLMGITGVFSMFMSNTATTAMMLAILMPVLKAFDPADKGKTAFVLGIPFAANIGGIGTPIGTPPNAVALKYLTGEQTIGFGQWMGFAVPYVLVLLVVTWLVLCVQFPAKQQHLEIEIRGQFLKHWKAVVVYVTSAATILLWLTDFWHGMNVYVVAMIPVGIFAAAQIITAEDLKRISWDVLWLVAGGIALGQGLEESGLAQRLVTSIPFSAFSPYVIVGVASLLAWGLSCVMSHTATANLLLPMVAALGGAVSGLGDLGGLKMLILLVTFACSLAMILPISTPPNAMAHATGWVNTRQMAHCGGIVGVIGMLGALGLMALLHRVGFF
jgi:sodium-dependent dicarboxylate transporter 2/3/5